MRNIALIDYYKLQIPALQEAEFYDLEEFSYTFYIITKSRNIIALKLDQKNPRKFEIVFEFQISSDDIEDDDNIVDLKYILDLESIVIVTKKGMVLQFKINEKEIEPVGMFDDGVCGAQWSPNQEQLIIASQNSNLISLNTEFDILNEVPIDDQNEQLIQDSIVNISWKNDAKFFMTNYQIQGGRKALARDSELNMFRSAAKSDPEGGWVESIAEKSVKNLKGCHHWQPNANFIAGWDRKLLKDQTDKYETRVIFWEKNGLRHYEFQLPTFQKTLLKGESDLLVQSLQFNRDSDILAVLTKDSQQKEYVLLYHRSNYRWYLKKVFEGQVGKQIQQVFWCNTEICRLFILYKNSNIEVLNLNLSHSQNTQDTALKVNLGTQIAVDNSQILTNLYAKNIMPAPMSNFSFQAQDSVDGFSFGYNYVFAITNASFELFQISKKMELKIFQCENTLIKNTERVRAVIYNEKEKILVAIKNQNDIIQVHFDIQQNKLVVKSHKISHLPEQFASEQILAVCGSASLYKNFNKLEEENKEAMEEEKQNNNNNFGNNNNNEQFIFQQPQADEDEQILENQNSNSDFIYFSTSTGNILKYVLDNQKITHRVTLPVPAMKIVATQIFGDEKILGISQNHRLMYDTKIVCPECTSFTVYKSFLLFTAKSQQLYEILYVLDFKDPKSALHELEANIYYKLPKQGEGDNFVVRNIERGCKIVQVTNSLKLIFQASRGNLEGIYPRILLLKKVRDLIEKNKYKLAFEMCRTHKLDINLIFDIDPKRFLENSSEILQQIQDTDFMNIFIQSLNNDLSHELVYSLTAKQHKQVTSFFTQEMARTGKNKVNTICDLVIRDLEALNDNDTYLYTIMTTHVKKQPSELDTILYKIKLIKDQEVNQEPEVIPPHLNKETNQKFKASKQVTARKILEFVCWLTEADKMYEVALLTFDLDLVAMVAEFTQKDPKEYLPYLEKVKAIENQVEYRYTICMDLKKPAFAIQELGKGNQEQKDRSLELIKKHNLYNIGIQTYQQEPDMLKKIKNYLGDYLSSKQEYAQSMLAYESAQNHVKALEQARNAYDFVRIMHFSKLLKHTKEEKAALLEELLQEGKESHQNSFIGHVLKKQKKYSESIPYFIKGDDWKSVVQSLNFIDTIESQEKVKKDVIYPAIQLAANIKGNQLKKFIIDFTQRSARLKVLQTEKRNTPSLLAHMRQLGGGTLQKDFDTESDISEHTQITTSSRTSYTVSQTTGMRKKRDKKRKQLQHRNIQEGSPLEEEFLVAVLKDIQSQQNIFTEAKGLIQYLIYFEQLSAGEQLNKLMLELEFVSNKKVKSLQQEIFEEQHPELAEVYPHIEEYKQNKPKVYEISLNNFEFMYPESANLFKPTKQATIVKQ